MELTVASGNLFIISALWRRRRWRLVLKPARQVEDQENQHGQNDSQKPLRQPDSRAEGGRNEQRGGRSNTLDPVAGAAANDSARAQKAHTGDDGFEKPNRVGAHRVV